MCFKHSFLICLNVIDGIRFKTGLETNIQFLQSIANKFLSLLARAFYQFFSEKFNVVVK